MQAFALTTLMQLAPHLSAGHGHGADSRPCCQRQGLAPAQGTTAQTVEVVVLAQVFNSIPPPGITLMRLSVVL